MDAFGRGEHHTQPRLVQSEPVSRVFHYLRLPAANVLAEFP